ncbi:transcriptional regulator, XRE family [Solidesulfovibrio fructosivorans JJ]]|uniref:Transcriptional regulator, XRE family n=1 Tax=Solidesulfovibrio fructosivorans JJ] TaxID=596151 RepID=E1JRC6_SOLFR|nr:helix-turn-helix transcriptional regulator [Solidesulfovibrio fructosivorans]EFL53127.1 transcriptional regulator, XRE family [Solidesulfovibrio fructosivorans JJ]]
MKSDDTIEFASRLRELIQALKIKDVEFALSGGVTKQTLSGYLTGKREPGRSTLANWVNAFHVNGTWLLTGEGEMLGDQGKTETPAIPLEELSEKLTPAQREMLTYKRTMQELGAVPERIIDGIEAIAMGKTRAPKSSYATAEPPADPGYNNVHEPGSDFGKDT